MWVLNIGPFRGKRMRTARLIGMIVLVILLATLAWQVLSAILEPPPGNEQPTSGTVITQQHSTGQNMFQRVLTHLRSWYRDGF